MFGLYRTLLAMMVVASHIGGIPDIGAYAVFGFYALSGYLMTFIMHESYGYTVGGVRKYAINRFLRLFPMYWISIGVTVILIVVNGEAITSAYHRTLYLPDSAYDWLRNLLIFFPFREPPRLTPPAWALTVEIFFYIAIAVGLSRYRTLAIVWFAFSVIWHLFVMVNGLGAEYMYFSIAAASLPFSTGALIYHYKSRIAKLLQSFGDKRKWLPVLLFFLLLCNYSVSYSIGSRHQLFFYTNYVLSAVLIMVLAQRDALPFLSRKVDNFLGTLSYPIYLLHYQVALITIQIFEVLGWQLLRPSIPLLLLTTPILVLSAMLSHQVVDKPIENLRRGVKNSEAVRASRTARAGQ